MTAQQHKPRVVHVSSAVGDDELGDGSTECPVATLERAEQISGYGDIIAYDGMLGSLVPAQKAVPHPSEKPVEEWRPRTMVGVVLGLAVILWGYLALVAAALDHNPSLAVLLVAVPAVLVAMVWPERDR